MPTDSNAVTIGIICTFCLILALFLWVLLYYERYRLLACWIRCWNCVPWCQRFYAAADTTADEQQRGPVLSIDFSAIPAFALEKRSHLLTADACSICLEDFSAGSVLRSFACHHSFHRACVDPWLRLKATEHGSPCPLCRQMVPVTITVR